MKRSAQPAVLLLCLLFLLSVIGSVKAQNLVQYKVEVNGDGSASWTITQASDLNGTIDTWIEFQQRVAELIHSAQIETQREMSLDNNSLQLSTDWETQSHTTRYRFTWQNFSEKQTGTLIIGDVFQVEGFFGNLYGDGEIEISFPPTFRVESVSPSPNGDDTGTQTLEWLGTQLFVSGNPTITLAVSFSPSPTQDQTGVGVTELIYIVALLAIGLIAALFVALYFSRRKPNLPDSPQSLPKLAAESEEEKIVKTILANGGSVYQSALSDELRFSKAKTSQLLTALEKQGVVTRYKKGRDKIVSLTKQGKVEAL